MPHDSRESEDDFGDNKGYSESLDPAMRNILNRNQPQWYQDKLKAGTIRAMISHIGDDPSRDGLKDTPERVVRSWKELFSGYDQDPSKLFKVFDVAYDQMVVVKDVDFVSFCEHHLLPFEGVAHVAYIPAGKVVGLSKIARVVDVFARRLQVQERLTNEIGDCIAEHLCPKGVGVVLEAHHSCMSCRGVKKRNAKMITSYLSGVLRDEPDCRAEFLSLVRS